MTQHRQPVLVACPCAHARDEGKFYAPESRTWYHAFRLLLYHAHGTMRLGCCYISLFCCLEFLLRLHHDFFAFIESFLIPCIYI